jgi:hypothetical protein
VGLTDFLGNMLEFYEAADLEGQTWRAFTALWWDRFGDMVVSAGTLYELAVESELFSFGKTSERSQRVTFGKFLAHRRDRVFGEFRVLQGKDKQRVHSWYLQRGSGVAKCDASLEAGDGSFGWTSVPTDESSDDEYEPGCEL